MSDKIFSLSGQGKNREEIGVKFLLTVMRIGVSYIHSL